MKSRRTVVALVALEMRHTTPILEVFCKRTLKNLPDGSGIWISLEPGGGIAIGDSDWNKIQRILQNVHSVKNLHVKSSSSVEQSVKQNGWRDRESRRKRTGSVLKLSALDL